MKKQLRWYQDAAFQATIAYMSKYETKHPLIAMPTGSGKSLVIARLIEHCRKEWKAKILVLSHTEDILKQDYAQITSLIDEQVGLYSAGLKSRTIYPVTVAGIQSVFRRTDEFEQFDLVIIDEAHLINMKEQTMYKKFLANVGQIYCGLTATPFRLGSGLIYGKEDDKLFDDLVYDLTSLENFNRLIDEGYLCPLKTLETHITFDTTGIHKQGGDFKENELSEAFNREDITRGAIDEVIKVADKYGYKKWLFFAINIDHAENIAEYLIRCGIPTGLVHSKMEDDKDRIMEKHRIGAYTAMVNVGMLSTGYDDPSIDLICMLRPTESPVFHVQTAGRGTRPFPGKDHCMFMDFAGNTARLGPINAVHVKVKGKAKDGDGEPITKKCPECDTLHHPTVKVCPYCGYVFPVRTRLEAGSTGEDIISKGNYWFNVTDVNYSLSSKPTRPDIIKVSYICGLRVFNEYLCLNHKGYARFRAVNVLRTRANVELTARDLENCEAMMLKVNTLKKPLKILVNTSKKMPEVLQYKF